jgi:hypothetical protein
MNSSYQRELQMRQKLPALCFGGQKLNIQSQRQAEEEEKILGNSLLLLYIYYGEKNI